MHLAHNRVRSLVSPSVLSGAVAVLTAVAVLGHAAWKFIADGQLFYGSLFGAYGLKTYFWQTTPVLSGQGRALLDSAVVYRCLVAAAAVVAGLLVFVCLQIISMLFRSGKELVEEVGHVRRTARPALLHELAVRFGLRVAVLAGWALYTALFLELLFPYTVLLTQQGVLDLQARQPAGALACLAAVLLLAAGVHLQTVFLRLFLLRTRVFA